MVPSKHYFQANRRNGRLTLHVVTREVEEEEEHFGGQAGDDEEFSYRETQREKAEEEGIPMCVVSLYEGKSLDNKVEDSNYNTNYQSLKEEVCVKKSVGMHNSKVVHVGGSHLDMSLQRLNCIANNNNDSEDDNVISNVITLSLETSKVTLHKAQVLSFPHLSSYPTISSSLKQSAFIHSTGRNHGFLSSNHDMSTLPESKENFLWESNLMPCAIPTRGSWRIQRKSCSGGGGGCGGGRVTPAFVMEEISAKSLLLKAVSELATSLIVEAISYGSGDHWCLEEKKKLSSLREVVENGESGTIIGGYASDIMEGKIIGNDNGLVSHGAKSGYKASEGGMELNITLASSNELQFSSSNASEEWLHTLHCKELFDRHQLGQGLIKLHCIPTRS